MELNSTLATKQDILVLKGDIAAFEVKLSKKVEGFKSDVVRWMFFFWIAQLVVTFGSLWLFLRK